jgi:hypothetical protein
MLYGMEIKNGGEFEGRAFAASAVMHLDADLAPSGQKKVYGVVTRPFKATREQGDRLEHLGKLLPIEVDCIFEVVATQGSRDQAPGVRLDLVDLVPVSKPANKG